MPNALRLSVTLAASLAFAAACSASAAPSGSPGSGPPGSPGGSPGPSGPAGDFDHPTGASDVVLRYEEGGGFVMLEWSLTQVPIFTLYGDGTVVFRDPDLQPPMNENGLLVYQPMRTAKLSQEQMQQLLAFAVNEGGLAAARARYEHPGVADAGTAKFTINAGREKVVEVYALGLDEGAPDQGIRRQFHALAERLRSFDDGGNVPTAEYEPHGWRATLIDAEGALPAQVHPWPWPDLSPADFPADAEDPTLPGFRSRVMNADELAALNLGDLRGGLMGLFVGAADGKTYSIPLRPLLPDEDK